MSDLKRLDECRALVNERIHHGENSDLQRRGFLLSVFCVEFLYVCNIHLGKYIFCLIEIGIYGIYYRKMEKSHVFVAQKANFRCMICSKFKSTSNKLV